MTDNSNGPGPVLPPSRFGAGFSVGGPESQPTYPPPAFAAPEPPPPSPAYPPPPAAPMQYPVACTPYPVLMPVAYVPVQRTNGLAIAALVCPLVTCVLFPLGIIFGHIALSQIARTGEGGRGLAIAGLVISYVLAAIVGVFLLPRFLGVPF
ncbi:DUF4190 domain-containing protein [Mycolicibacterium sp. XJ662]